MAQYDIPILQENGTGKFTPVTLVPAVTRQELVTAPSTRVPSLWTRGAASISVSGNATATTIATVSTWTKIAVFDVNNVSLGATASHASDNITVEETGTYLVGFTASYYAAVASKLFTFGVLNGAAPILNVIGAEKPADTEVHCVSGVGLVSLTAADVITLQVMNQTNNDDVTVRDACLWLVQIA